MLDTESTVRTFWIPAFAGMTRVALLLSLFRDTALVRLRLYLPSTLESRLLNMLPFLCYVDYREYDIYFVKPVVFLTRNVDHGRCAELRQ